MSDSKPDAVPAGAEPVPAVAAPAAEPAATESAAAEKPAPVAVETTPAATAETPAAPSDAPAAAPAAAAPVDAAAPAATAAAATVAAPAPAAAPIAADSKEEAAAAPAPATEEASKEATETKPTTTKIQDLWAVAKAHEHKEIWGVTLADPDTHVPSQIVLQKYLNANDGDFAKAKDQLTKTLDWRAKTQPLELIKKSYPTSKFGGLGYVTTFTAEGGEKEIFTWNIYGGVKSIEETFGALQEFIDWRVALMELALQDLGLATATTPITEEQDPYKLYQVHDYKSISFLRQPPSVRSASSETIKVFAQNYPELLKEKFFVNVPLVMGFMYGLMKLFVAPKTLKKFHPMSNGGALAGEFKSSKVANLGEQLPKEYGGKGADLAGSGKQTTLSE